jgi:hypothetical protein
LLLRRAVRERAETAYGQPPAADQRLLQRVQVVAIGGINVTMRDKKDPKFMPTWDHGKTRWHLNFTTDPPHVTRENPSPKLQYFFNSELTATGRTFKNAVSGQRGKKKWSDLPDEVSTYVSTYFDQLSA